MLLWAALVFAHCVNIGSASHLCSKLVGCQRCTESLNCRWCESALSCQSRRGNCITWADGCSAVSNAAGADDDDDDRSGAGSIETPPTQLRYIKSVVTYFQGISVIPNRPRASGGPITRFLVFPHLPEGLVLNPQTGVIAGIPGVSHSTKSYLVEATNAFGKAVTQLHIRVVGTHAPTPVLEYGRKRLQFSHESKPRAKSILPLVTSSPCSCTGEKDKSGEGFFCRPWTNEGFRKALNTSTWCYVNSHCKKSKPVSAKFHIASCSIVDCQHCNPTISRGGGKKGAGPCQRYIPGGMKQCVPFVRLGQCPSEYQSCADFPISRLQYKKEKFELTHGYEARYPTSPSFFGGPVKTWIITPPIPSGFRFDPKTGQITLQDGAQLKHTFKSSFQVTASNSVSATYTAVSIRVTHQKHLRKTETQPPIPSPITSGYSSPAPTPAYERQCTGREGPCFKRVDKDISWVVDCKPFLENGFCPADYQPFPAIETKCECREENVPGAGETGSSCRRWGAHKPWCYTSPRCPRSRKSIVHEGLYWRYCVEGVTVPPKDLTYDPNLSHNKRMGNHDAKGPRTTYKYSGRVTEQIPAIRCSSNGGKIQRFFIYPPLPIGLHLNNKTGTISGIPEGPRVAPYYRIHSHFLITAMNEAGSATTKIQIKLKPAKTLSPTPYPTERPTFTPTNQPTKHSLMVEGPGSLDDKLSAERKFSIPSPSPRLAPDSQYTKYECKGCLGERGPCFKKVDSLKVCEKFLSADELEPGFVSNLPVCQKGYHSCGLHQIKSVKYPNGNGGDNNFGGTSYKLPEKGTFAQSVFMYGSKNFAKAHMHDVQSLSSEGGIIPAFVGGPIALWTVSPALPKGLQLDPRTGILNGKALHQSPLQLYRIQASNWRGSAYTNMSVQVYSIKVKAGCACTGAAMINGDGKYCSRWGADPNTWCFVSASCKNSRISKASGFHWAYCNPGAQQRWHKAHIEKIEEAKKGGMFSLAGPLGLTHAESATGTCPRCFGAKGPCKKVVPAPHSDTYDAMVTVCTAIEPGGLVCPQGFTVCTRPVHLTYSRRSLYLQAMVAMVPNYPHTHGAKPLGFAIKPKLPTGLILDENTGIISGTPQHSLQPMNYTVVAFNEVGSTKCWLALQVAAPTPSPTPKPTESAAMKRAEMEQKLVQEYPAGICHGCFGFPGACQKYSADGSTKFCTDPHTVLSVHETAEKNVPVCAPSWDRCFNSPSKIEYRMHLGIGNEESGRVVSSRQSSRRSEHGTQLHGRQLDLEANRKTSMIHLVPSSSGGPVKKYTVLPPLPNGLALNPKSGIIAGIPQQSTPHWAAGLYTRYTVLAANNGGAVDTALYIRVWLPTSRPTIAPTSSPTVSPTATNVPTRMPTTAPTKSPSISTIAPSLSPTRAPTQIVGLCVHCLGKIGPCAKASVSGGQMCSPYEHVGIVSATTTKVTNRRLATLPWARDRSRVCPTGFRECAGAEVFTGGLLSCLCTGQVAVVDNQPQGGSCRAWGSDPTPWCYVNVGCHTAKLSHASVGTSVLSQRKSKLYWAHCSNKQQQSTRKNEQIILLPPSKRENAEIAQLCTCTGQVSNGKIGGSCDRWGADPKPWCYVGSQCPQANMGSRKGLFWKHCSRLKTTSSKAPQLGHSFNFKVRHVTKPEPGNFSRNLNQVTRRCYCSRQALPNGFGKFCHRWGEVPNKWCFVNQECPIKHWDQRHKRAWAYCSKFDSATHA